MSDKDTGRDPESPLAWLRRRQGRDGEALIDPVEYAAGERLRRDHALALLTGRTTTDWSRLGDSGGRGGQAADVREAAMAARQRFERALAAVGPDLGGVLLDVCCHLKGLGDIEKDHGWPVRSGKVVLRLALAALARHYRLDKAATGPARQPLRQWGSEDYRPR